MSSATAQPDPTPDADPWVVLGEEWLAQMKEVRELTMAVMRATARDAIAALETPAAGEANARSQDTSSPSDAPAAAPTANAASRRQDPVEKIAKLSRIIRLTITLEAKLVESLRAYLAGEVVKAERVKEEAQKDPYAKLKRGRAARVIELVRDVIDHEIPDPQEYDILTDALDERLLFDEAYADIDHLPLRDIVERLCADLRLRPDWKRWAGDGWKPGPPFARPLCSYFKAPSRKPILADSPDPLPSG
jgi:hypothetical protein